MSTDLLDDLIRSVLNDPLPDEPALDWVHVLRRLPAAPVVAAPRARRSRARRALLVALVLAIVFVPPAVAFHRELADWILGKPAPESVSQAFRGWNLLQANARERADLAPLFVGRLSQVVVGEAQGVAELETAQGTVSLWDVPQRGGGRCWLFVFGEVAGSAPNVGSCDRDPAEGAIRNAEWVKVSKLPDVVIVHARVFGAAEVEIRNADGTLLPMEVVAGHAVASIPAGSTPVALVASDSDGKVVQMLPFLVPPPGIQTCAGICSGGVGSTISHFGSVTMRKR